MANPKSLVPFKKGEDKRRNVNGRPKSFKQLRALVVSISGEPIKEGTDMTLIEERIRKMLKSDNPADAALVLKYGWGNVPEQTDVTSGGDKLKAVTVIEIIKSKDE